MSFSAGGRPSRTAASNDFALANTLLCSASPGAKKIVCSQAIFQRSLAAEEFFPAQAQLAQRRIVALRPLGDLHQHRPFGQMQIVVQMFQRIAGEEMLFAIDENLLQAEVDRPNGAMEIDRAEKFRPHGDEPHEAPRGRVREW